MLETAPATGQLWIVRHGLSTFNAAGRFQGCLDEPRLTPRGREDSRAAGAFLAQAGIRRLICSPLARARETAEEIAAHLGGPAIEIEPALREIELGAWEGARFEEVRCLDRAGYRRWTETPEAFEARDADGRLFQPVQEIFERVGRFWRGLTQRHIDGPVLVVTHGGAAKALLASAIGLGPPHFHLMQQSNAALSRLSWRGSESRLQLLNWTGHLGAHRLPKLKSGRTGHRLILAGLGLADAPWPFEWKPDRALAPADGPELAGLPEGVPVERLAPLDYARRLHELQPHGELQTTLAVAATRRLLDDLPFLLAIPASAASRAGAGRAPLGVIHFPAPAAAPVWQMWHAGYTSSAITELF